MTKRGSPYWTGCPLSWWTLTISPATSASISFISFIASMMQRTWPTRTLVTLAALAWLFLRLAAEGELRQELLERGLDPRAVQRAVRYGRGQELSEPR